MSAGFKNWGCRGKLTAVFVSICRAFFKPAVRSKVVGALAFGCLSLGLHSHSWAHGSLDALETIVVEGRKVNLLGEVDTASEGVVGQKEIELRPLLRTGEVLEFIPGMVVTQHSGTGKANQYFLRGFNLDHGTDFNTEIDGVPINMRSHGHGQGYADLNFIIPEFIHAIEYKKGSYYADVGDFSGAGAARLSTANALQYSQASVSAGEDHYWRVMGMGQKTLGQEGRGQKGLGEKRVIAALEANIYDGPWRDVNEELDKLNLVLKAVQETESASYSLSLMAYNNSWNSADQIPERAVEQARIDELGSIDTDTGGKSSRYSLNFQAQVDHFKLNAYAIAYDMQLWSNFTYYLDDPVLGDEFEQVDHRSIIGVNAEYQFSQRLFSRVLSHRYGSQIRYDMIDEVGLYKSQQRQRLGTVRSDELNELSSSVFWESQLYLNADWRFKLGARYDYFQFDVEPLVNQNINNIDLSENGGRASDAIASLKASAIYSINAEWESYFSVGQGFHSNDARGSTIKIDPADGSTIQAVDPLVRSLGYELGLRGFIGEKINTALALWQLDLDSELLFVGDAGNTEASRATSRRGLELSLYYQLLETINLDLEYAWTEAEFADNTEQGQVIPGALKHVLQAGIVQRLGDKVSHSLRWRYFGKRPLEESASIKSEPSSLWNYQLAYQGDDWGLKLQVLNMLDSRDHDIDYYYASQLMDEDEAVEDLHYHPIEPRTLRVTLNHRF